MPDQCPAQFRSLDFCDPKTHDDPYEMYDYFLEHEPLYYDEKNGIWAVFRYDDVVRIARDPRRSSAGKGFGLGSRGSRHDLSQTAKCTANSVRWFRRVSHRVRCARWKSAFARSWAS